MEADCCQSAATLNVHLSLDLSQVPPKWTDGQQRHRMEGGCYIPHLSFSSAGQSAGCYHPLPAPPPPDASPGPTQGEASWRPLSPGARLPPRSEMHLTSSSPSSTSPQTTSAMRACVDMEMSGTFPLATVDMEPLPNIFGFPSGCAPPHYKELSLTKEKEGGHGMADALLSLKHAVVHPSQAPLSPGAFAHHFPSSHGAPHPPSSMHNSSFYSCQGAPPPPPPGGHLSGYPSACGQYPSGAYSEQVPQGSPSHGQTPSNMFPSMSVNVSMSMNVGMPLNGNLPCTPSMEQWSPHPTPMPPPHASQYSPTLHPSQNQQYSSPNYSMQNPAAYTSSY
uniref:Uncharacterized protein n=2 Tax=Capitella teleta TaxID=283909 RepID=X2A9Z2_CAPTE